MVDIHSREHCVTKVVKFPYKDFISKYPEWARNALFCFSDMFTFLELTNTLPQSTSCVVMAIRLDFSCQIMRHMSATVVSFGPAKDLFWLNCGKYLYQTRHMCRNLWAHLNMLRELIYNICATQRHSQSITFSDHWTIYRSEKCNCIKTMIVAAKWMRTIN